MSNYNMETNELLVKKLMPILMKEYEDSEIVVSQVTSIVSMANRVGATNGLINSIDSNTTYKDVMQYIKDVENRDKDKRKEENKQKAKKYMIIGAIMIVAIVVIFLFK